MTLIVLNGTHDLSANGRGSLMVKRADQAAATQIVAPQIVVVPAWSEELKLIVSAP